MYSIDVLSTVENFSIHIQIKNNDNQMHRKLSEQNERTEPQIERQQQQINKNIHNTTNRTEHKRI